MQTPVTLHTSGRKHILRIALSAGAYVIAFLAFPTLALVVACLSFILVGGFEAIGVGLVLDALLSPRSGVLGPYHHTALLLGIAPLIYWIRSRTLLSKKNI